MIASNSTIGEIVAQDYRSAAVFKKYGIDFCCGGGKALENVCQEKQIDPGLVLADLVQSLEDQPQQRDYHNWSPERLADHIENTHHVYVKSATEDLKQYLAKVVRVHGNHHPELLEIEKAFLLLAGELAMHLQKEELILFPFIRKMAKSHREGSSLKRPHFYSIRNPIRMMEDEHSGAGDYMARIRRLSGNFTSPESACNTFRVTYKLLDEFESDLHLHVHLENNLLFPQAIALEDELFEGFDR